MAPDFLALSAWPVSALCSAQLRLPDGGVLLRLLVLAPLLEECALRGGLQECLIRRWPTVRSGAVLASSTVFGLLHLGAGPAHALAVTGPGLLLACLYQGTRSVTWCVLLHAAMNGVALAACTA